MVRPSEGTAAGSSDTHHWKHLDEDAILGSSPVGWMSDCSSELRPVGASYLHVPSPPSEAQQLLVLAGDEVNGGVLQQGREDEEQTHGHPDVDGFYVGHLQTVETRSEPDLVCCQPSNKGRGRRLQRVHNKLPVGPTGAPLTSATIKSHS